MEKKTKDRGVTVFFSKTGAPERKFPSKGGARTWIMEGMFACEGAERDHYVSMLKQLEIGKKRLDYDLV